MFLTKMRNRGGRSFLGKDVWFIKEQAECDVSVEGLWEGGTAARTWERSGLKAIHRTLPP